MSNNLIPSYLENDYNTIKSRLIEQLQKTDTFKDYNYEGANISILIEMVSYLGDLNNFYNNKLAQNSMASTADIYEAVHSSVLQQGHEPKGYRAGVVSLTVTLTGAEGTNFTEGEQLYVPPYFNIDTGLLTEDGDVISYSTTASTTYTISASDVVADSCSFDVLLREGIPTRVIYTGEDIIDNQIILPDQQFDHEDYPYNIVVPSIIIYVNGIPWEQVPDFYDMVSGLYTESNVYKIKYDKYKRYVVQFSPSRNVPEKYEEIVIYSIATLGLVGAIGANIITTSPDTYDVLNFLTNITTDTILDAEFYTVVNSEASIGSSDPETSDEMRESGLYKSHAQYRNVTPADYIGNLETRGDITRANAWGEAEQSPGNTLEYNKIYISFIPTDFSENSMVMIDVELPSSITDTPSATVSVPVSYEQTLESDIKEFLEPRKMMNVYENFPIPSLVFFKFDIGIKIKRVYNYSDVLVAVKAKMSDYFDSDTREFNEVIDFRELTNYILDTSGELYEDIRGIDSFIIRDIIVFVPDNTGDTGLIEEPNTSGDYPQYTTELYGAAIDNSLRPIKLGLNQFPILLEDYCVYTNEG